MQRITIRWFGALAAALGFGGIAAAQYPTTPAAQQTAGFSPNAPWMNQLPAAKLAIPADSEPLYLQVQAVAPATQPAPKAGPGTPTTPATPAIPVAPYTPGSFPYSQQQGSVTPPPPTVAASQPPIVPPYQPTAFGTYGAPAYPRNLAFNVGLAPVPYAYYEPNCANGCGSLKSDLAMVFGSCRTFFNPCGPIPCNCDKGDGTCKSRGLNKCGTFPYGHPYASGCNMCKYSSYGDR